MNVNFVKERIYKKLPIVIRVPNAFLLGDRLLDTCCIGRYSRIFRLALGLTAKVINVRAEASKGPAEPQVLHGSRKK